MILEDATGTGNKGKIDNRNELRVNSRTRQRYQVRAGEGQMFVIGTPLFDLTPSINRTFWFRFEEPSLQFHMHRIMISFDGGTATRNKTLVIRTYVGDSVPSANATAGAGINALLGSLITFEHSFYYWDGVGTGMTIDTPGVAATALLPKIGLSDLVYEGTLVIGPQSVLSFDTTPEEDGKAAITMWGYLINPTEEA